MATLAAPQGRRERNKSAKLARIVRAARRLFAAQGFAATTTQQIAAAADIGTGTLYLYAESKDDLLILVAREEIPEVVDQAAASAPARRPVLDRLMHVFDRLIEYHRTDLPLARAFMKQLSFVGSAERRQDAAHITQHLQAHMRLLIEAAQAAGELVAELPIELLVGNLFSIYRMQLQSWLSEFVDLDSYRARLRASLDLQLQGFRTAPGGKSAWPRAPERSSSPG